MPGLRLPGWFTGWLPRRCPECGLPMLRDPTRRRHDCPACGIHAPYGHKSRDGAGTGAPGVDEAAFDQRGYHQIVVEHGRAGFLRGDYFGAVRDCCQGLEGLVRGRSGLEGYGRDLMARALSPKERGKGLETSLSGVSEKTRDSVQEGTMHLCMGIMASARNPTAHESRSSFPISRHDALEILSVISHVCRQIDRMGPRSR